MSNKKVMAFIFRRYYWRVHCDPSRVDLDQKERLPQENLKRLLIQVKVPQIPNAGSLKNEDTQENKYLISTGTLLYSTEACPRCSE